jgi:hypothetical protein
LALIESIFITWGALNSKLTRRLSQFGGMNLKTDIAPKKVEIFERKKAVLLEEITIFQNELEVLKNKRSELDKHIELKSQNYPKMHDLVNSKHKQSN